MLKSFNYMFSSLNQGSVQHQQWSTVSGNVSDVPLGRFCINSLHLFHCYWLWCMKLVMLLSISLAMYLTSELNSDGNTIFLY
jgi:hypothetical protein